MEILKWVLVFAVSLFVLLKSADFFTNAAEKIGLHFKIPPFIIGVTVIALGTSLPEIATSTISVIDGHSEIVIGNVAGSNIANILLVLAFTAIVGKKILIDKDIIKIDLPFLIGSTIVFFITILDGVFTYKEGILALLLLGFYLAYNATSERKVDPKEETEQKEEAKEQKKFDWWQPVILLATGAGLYLSAKYTIDSVVAISEILNIAKELIAISAIAIGTSLPELAVSIVAVRQKKADIAIGNITGSNIFNALGVMGIPAFFGNLEIPQQMIIQTIPILIFVTILYVFVTMTKEISKWEGYMLLTLYLVFMGFTFNIL